MCGDGKEAIREIRDGEVVGLNVPVMDEPEKKEDWQG